jgi:hypothetical protein
MVLVDTAGCEMGEQAEEEGDSIANKGEAEVGTGGIGPSALGNGFFAQIKTVNQFFVLFCQCLFLSY